MVNNINSSGNNNDDQTPQHPSWRQVVTEGEPLTSATPMRVHIGVVALVNVLCIVASVAGTAAVMKADIGSLKESQRVTSVQQADITTRLSQLSERLARIEATATSIETEIRYLRDRDRK